MKPISTEAILSQIRALNAELTAPSARPVDEPKSAGFGQLLKDSIASVSETQAKARDMAVAFDSGTSDVSLVEVMVTLQEADLSFRAMTEVRNKLVAAYQEIMQMPV